MIGCRKIAIALVIPCLISGCSNRSDRSAGNQVVIRVDDRKLTLAEFNEYFEAAAMSCDDEQTQDRVSMRETRLHFLLQLIEEMLILRRADDLHLDISPEELDIAVRDIRKNHSEPGFNYLFLKQAISFEAWKERLKTRLLVEKVIRKELLKEVSPTPQAIRDYYDKHWEEWNQAEEIRARHILLPSKEKAKHVLRRLESGDDFAALARDHSVAPEAQEGGDMGYVARGQLPGALEKPLFDLELGDVTPVIKTPYGFHILQAVEKREARKPKIEECIEKIREGIQKEQLEATYGSWLTELRSRYRIEINEGVI